MKRKDYLSWDQYFMGIAMLSAQRSKDPHTQVGACIVSPDKKILSMGYKGIPIGCDDDKTPWTSDGDPLDTKYLYVCHAEFNAILNSGAKTLRDATIYVTLFPCNECTKAIIQCGIKKVVYLEDKYPDSDAVIASKRMMDMTGIEYVQYPKPEREITLTL